jgi:integrase
MRGNINWQVQEIFYKSGINQIGTSKHTAKEFAKKQFSQDGDRISPSWHSIGKKIGIYSYKTADNYRDVWRQLGKYVKEVYNIRDFERIAGEHVRSFLDTKIDKGVAHNTFMLHASALEKLETALNGYAKLKESGIRYEFSKEIKTARDFAHLVLARFTGARGYDDPKSLIEAISDPIYHLVAKIQLESGCRVSECTFLSISNLKGYQKDPVIDEQKGMIFIEKAKGGKSGNKYMSTETYNELEKRIKGSENERFVVDNNNYRNSLKKAAQITKQKYTGTHGLRWNFAQNRFYEVQTVGGLFYTQALYQVSDELFHERANITTHYLKK